jgi:hypothetical protein
MPGWPLTMPGTKHPNSAWSGACLHSLWEPLCEQIGMQRVKPAVSGTIGLKRGGIGARQ